MCFQVGDFVYLKEDESVPCDLVVLSSSHVEGHCFVMTSNLDGETSLKTRFASPLTKSLRDVGELGHFTGYVECENPNPKLDNFLGRMATLPNFSTNDSQTCSLSLENLLLAGTVLKNTKFVFGLCVYSGTQTKMSLNSKITVSES